MRSSKAILGLAGLVLLCASTLRAEEGPSVVGSWKAAKYNGEAKDEAYLWTFSADGKWSMVVKDGDDTEYQSEGTYTADTSVTPNRIVVTVTKEDGDEKNDKYYGAFRADKGALLLKHSTKANADPADYPKTLDVEDDFDTYELVENK